MPGKAAKVVISERQQQLLDQFCRSRSEPYSLRQRAHVILLAFAGLLNEQIASQVHLERHQVGLWRARWAEAFDRLRNALAAKAAAARPQPGERALEERIAALEAEKAELADELDRLRVKRDKDVAALDDLIAQLKPLIEEV